MCAFIYLIVGLLMLDAASSGESDKQIGRFMYRLTFAVSTFYLVMVGLIPLVQPFTGLPPVELMQRSNQWLGPLQGLVAAALGAFVVQGERGGGEKARPRPTSALEPTGRAVERAFRGAVSQETAGTPPARLRARPAPPAGLRGSLPPGESTRIGLPGAPLNRYLVKPVASVPFSVQSG